MKVGLFASNEYPYPLPPGKIQAALAMAGLIADGLTDLGEEVMFFCSEDSETKANKISLRYHSMYYNKVSKEILAMLPRNHVKTMNIQRMFSDVISYLQENPVDVLHLHNIRETLPFLKFLPGVPKVITMHDSPFFPHHRYYLEQYKDVSDIHFVSISKNQRRALSSDFSYAGNVYNGIDTQKFSFSSKPEDKLIFVGRFLKTKGVDTALHVAQRAKKDIITVGFFPWNEEKTSDFYQEVSELLNKSNVEHYEHVSHETDIPRLFARAKAMLFPIRWEEPFGLTLIEAMACGTPVIAFNRGSVSEVIKEGVTGFIVESEKEMIEAVKKIDNIDRMACRKHVEEHFTTEVMVKNYRNVYKKIIKK